MRTSRLIAGLALASCAFSLGCSSVREVPVNETLESPGRVIAVIYPSGAVVEFNEEGGVINTYRGTIDGVTTRGDVVSIPLDDSLRVRMLRTDGAKSAAWTVGAIGIVAAVIVIVLYSGDFSF